MRKRLFVVVTVLILLVAVSGVISAYSLDRVFSQMLGAKSLIYADWQMDYLVPLDPGELNRGDYRFTANVGRFEPKTRQDGIYGLGIEEENINNFYFALDTGIRDNLYMRLSMDYVPNWDSSDEWDVDHKVYNIYFDYKTENDNSLYFGYNRFNMNIDEFDDGVLVSEDQLRVNYYFVGYEMRGSFSGGNEE